MYRVRHKYLNRVRHKTVKMEFQAVILAAGRGSRYHEMSAQKAKCLLPIYNSPMILYPLNNLYKNGFREAIVVCLDAEKNELSLLPKKYNLDGLDLDLVTLSELGLDEDSGTADALRQISYKIKSQRLLIISCDLISDVQMHNLTDVHRVHRATLTALMAKTDKDKSVPVPGPKSKSKAMITGDGDLVGINPDNNNRLCFLTSKADLEDVVSIRRSVLKEHPRLVVHSDLMDAHCYIMESWVLNILKANP